MKNLSAATVAKKKRLRIIVKANRSLKLNRNFGMKVVSVPGPSSSRSVAVGEDSLEWSTSDEEALDALCG